MSLFNLDDYQKQAKRKLSKPIYEYIASGSDDEQTLAENQSAFKLWYLLPRVLRPMGNLSTETTLFGRRLAMPVFTSPAGVQSLCHPDGECATARACGHHGIVFGLSQHSTKTIQQVAEAAPNTIRWYQSYILKDKQLTLRLIHQAIQAGYEGIVLTVDSVKFGYREADARNMWDSLPAPHRLVNYDGTALDLSYNAQDAPAWDQTTETMFDMNVTWEHVRWIKENCRGLPLVVKGIMTPDDALLAIDHGADGIMVSNHGGRQLDGCLATIDALPIIAAAVQGRVPILLDGGIRRGTDIVKALALGATVVGIGKPVFFALSIHGEEGVKHMLHLLKAELEVAMALCGCQCVHDIIRQQVSRHPSGGPVVRYTQASL